MEDMRNAYNIFVSKSEGKRPLGRPRRRWEDNIRMGLREIGWKVVGRLYLVRNNRDEFLALVNTLINFPVL
jgi:hypothetical protein